MDARRRWFKSLPTWSQLPKIGMERGPGGRFEEWLEMKWMKK